MSVRAVTQPGASPQEKIPEGPVSTSVAEPSRPADVGRKALVMGVEAGIDASTKVSAEGCKMVLKARYPAAGESLDIPIEASRVLVASASKWGVGALLDSSRIAALFSKPSQAET